MQNDVSYAQAVATRFPEQIVICIARDPSGKYNPITLGWTMLASSKPPMMAIGVGKKQYSLEAIRCAGEFVVAFPSESQKDDTWLFGSKSGRDMDKIAASGCAVELAGAIDCVILTDAVANFECKLVDELETGDHVLCIGEVVRSHMNPDTPNRLYTVGSSAKLGGVEQVESQSS